MNPFGIVATVGFAVFFYRVAMHEHMTGWVWSTASAVLSLVIMQLSPKLLPVVAVQVVLFGVLWRQHIKRQAEITAQRVGERERREAQRDELLRRGRAESERDRAHREDGSAQESTRAEDADSGKERLS